MQRGGPHVRHDTGNTRSSEQETEAVGQSKGRSESVTRRSGRAAHGSEWTMQESILKDPGTAINRGGNNLHLDAGVNRGYSGSSQETTGWPLAGGCFPIKAPVLG